MARPIRHDLVDAAVLEVLGLVSEQGWLADRALDRVLRRERRLYASERRAIAEAVYGILRFRGQLAWLASSMGGGARRTDTRASHGDDAGAGLDLATLYALWLVRHERVSSDAAGRRLGVEPGLLSAATERADARIAALRDPIERLAVEGSLPRWIAERFLVELGERDARALADALNLRAPLTIRANTLRTTREALQQRLRGEGVHAAATRHSPWGLVLDGHANAFALDAFREGCFEIQDEGSQIIALAVAARPGQTVADACAGAGGKSLALAAEMHGKGSLFALDIDGERLGEARRRARRAGVHNLRTRPIPGGAEADAALADLTGRCDRVLVDAPCSGLGTLRRKPDARWRLRPEDPERFGALQRDLVMRFARLLAPAGHFIYATCSIGPSENAGVAAFIEQAVAGLKPLPLPAVLGAERARSLGADGHTLQLWPHVHGTDGFFIAAFAREP